VLRELVRLFGQTDAGAFQARELKFSFLNARLWLLIALARVALDHPHAVARYKSTLMRVTQEMDAPHVVMRHFAAQALLVCDVANAMPLSNADRTRLKAVNVSPYPRLKRKIQPGGGFYEGRPTGAPEPTRQFSLDMDFDKLDVQHLSRVFGQSGWEVKDMMSEIAYNIAPDVTSMYDSGGRELTRDRNDRYGMSSRFQTFAQHLGWHALHISAGRLLSDFPVTEDAYYWGDEDPWTDHLNDYLLTRRDGYWLSDGTDRYPLDIHRRMLISTNNNEGEITGDPEMLLSLLGIKDRIPRMLTVCGRWFSPDNVRISISSSLVSPKMAASRAKSLIRAMPFSVWLPSYTESQGAPQHLRNKKLGHVPWIVSSDFSAQLDEHDVFGGPSAVQRPRLTNELIEKYALTADDPFHRCWRNKRGSAVVHAEAWGVDNDHGAVSRLKVSSALIKRMLADQEKNLLILINLQRYEEKNYRGDGHYTHSVAVARINRSLEVEYFKGRVNHLHKSHW
jgi:hypothetical protein